jgi:hypothetical protein
MKREANKINSTENKCHSTVPECFRKPLMKVAYKLLSKDKATFEDLTPSEQQLWNYFKTDQIYRLLTGELDTVPEFRFSWYTVTGGDAMANFIPDQAPPIQPRITRAARSIPVTLMTPALIPMPKVKTPKASTSARPAQSSSSSSSPLSTVPSSPSASTSGTVPKPAQSTQTSGSSTTSSKLPTPTAPTAEVSTRQLRPHKDINYQKLHLGRNIRLGRREYLKRNTWKSVGKAVQHNVEKVRKVAEEFPVVSRRSS